MNRILSRAKLLQATFANWHFDHTVNRSVIGEYSFSPEGINLVSALYFSQNVALPVALHFVLKTELFTDPKTGKERFQSPITKNEIAQTMVASAVKKQIIFRYVLADTWSRKCPLGGISQSPQRIT